MSFYFVIAPGGGENGGGEDGGRQGKKKRKEEGFGQVWVTTEEKVKIESRNRKRVGSVKATYRQVRRTSPLASGLSEAKPRVGCCEQVSATDEKQAIKNTRLALIEKMSLRGNGKTRL